MMDIEDDNNSIDKRKLVILNKDITASNKLYDIYNCFEFRLSDFKDEGVCLFISAYSPNMNGDYLGIDLNLKNIFQLQEYLNDCIEKISNENKPSGKKPKEIIMNCGNVLDNEEKASPCKNEDGDIICDKCWQDKSV